VAKVIFTQVRLPLFSIKHPEAFQVMSAIPFPQPSSLIGALAYCLGIMRGIGTKAYDIVLKMVEKGEILAARARPLGVPGESKLPLTPSSVILRRFRVADKAHETKRKKERKPIVRLMEAIKGDDMMSARRILEVELTDAFYREYLMGFDLICAWVFHGAEIDPNLLWLMPRLGDTESLCSVIRVWQEEVELESSGKVDTCFPAPSEGVQRVEGSFMLMRICDEQRIMRPFIIPCEYTIEKGPRGKYPVVRPSIVTIEYDHPVSYCRTSMGNIVLRGI